MSCDRIIQILQTLLSKDTPHSASLDRALRATFLVLMCSVLAASGYADPPAHCQACRVEKPQKVQTRPVTQKKSSRIQPQDSLAFNSPLTANAFKQWFLSTYPHGRLNAPSALVHRPAGREVFGGKELPVAFHPVVKTPDTEKPEEKHLPPTFPTPEGFMEPLPAWEALPIEPGDRLSVNVNALSEFSQEAVVLPASGILDFAYIGSVQVQGHSVHSLEQLLTQHYQEYLVTPQVEVTLQHKRATRPSVFGAVEALPADSENGQRTPAPHTVVSALQDHYFIDFRQADLSHVYRVDPTHQTLEEIDLTLYLATGYEAANPILEPNQWVYVPRLNNRHVRSDADVQTLIQSTLGPKEASILLYGKGLSQPLSLSVATQALTLRTVLTESQVLTRGKYPQKVRIVRYYRGSKNKPEQLVWNARKGDTFLLPGDQVEIVKY